jgi:hypothetical protein
MKDSPPEALPVELDGISAELKRRPRWVNWRYALDGEKWTKHPYNPRTGRKASSTDLLTWSTFEDVLAAHKAGGYDCVGFVFCSGDPYAGVDLDGCRDPESGQIKAWAAEILRGLDSYTELSPCGFGLRGCTLDTILLAAAIDAYPIGVAPHPVPAGARVGAFYASAVVVVRPAVHACPVGR